MNDIQNFKFGELEVRTAVVNNEPYFVASDICKVLGYQNGSKAIKDHVDDEDKGVTKCSTLGGMQEMVIVNESGLYSLILSSKMPNAKQFKHWVTSEVLPCIRKKGLYATDELLANPDLLIQLATELKIERETNKRLEQQALLNQPKVDFYDEVAASKDAITISEVAKVLGIPGLGRNKLFERLREDGVLMGNNEPYQKYIDKGWFRVVESKFKKPSGETCINIKTLVFQKGLDGIRKLLNLNVKE